jgi:uncharacterized protein
LQQAVESSHASSAGSGVYPGAGPVTERERIVTLDVLRGFALFGILMVNMPFFSLPFMQGIFDPSLAEGPVSEQAAFLFVKLFFEYKFVSLFSLLFGIGFAVQLSRARARGGPFVGIYLRRIGILFLIGLAHALLLWFGDILLFYSVIALALLLCRNLSPRTLIYLAAGALAVGLFLALLNHGAQQLSVHFAGEQMQQRYAEAQAALDEGRRSSGIKAVSEAQFDPNNPIWQDGELRAFRDGPFADAMTFRLITYAFAVVHTIFGFGWHILAMFLLGAAMMKAGFFRADRRHWHRRLAMIALPIGLIFEAAHAASYAMGGYGFSPGITLTLPLHEIGSVLLMLGYVGVICLIVSSGALKRLTDAIAAAGRMALTVYLSQTIIATGIMYWWGLGWFGSVNRVQMIGLTILIYIALVLLSVLWLRAFCFGPLEWLWRTLTYLKLQPIRRT